MLARFCESFHRISTSIDYSGRVEDGEEEERSTTNLAYNLDILSQLLHGFLAAQPRGSLKSENSWRSWRLGGSISIEDEDEDERGATNHKSKITNLAYNLDILSQLLHGFLAAQPRGSLKSKSLGVLAAQKKLPTATAYCDSPSPLPPPRQTGRKSRSTSQPSGVRS